MWLVDHRFWKCDRRLDPLERSKLYVAACDEWLMRHEDMPGLDPFDEDGAWLLEECERAIRAGDRW